MIEQYNFVDSTLPMKCLLCGIKTNKIMKVVAGVHIYECEKCRLGFVDQAKTVKKNLDKQYQLKEYKKEEKMIVARLEPIIDNIIKYKSSGAVLEIGPGYGLFSSLLLKKGNYKLDIVEPYLSPHYLLGNTFKLHKTNLDEFLMKNKKKFDLIIMFDVIEHLEDPFSALHKLKNILKKEGILVVQTPNYQSLMQWMTKKWSWWMIEDHKWFFCPSSFQKALRKNGLNEAYSYTYEDWIDLKKNLDGNFAIIKNNILRKFVKGFLLIPFRLFYLLTRRAIWKMGYGGLLLVIARLDAVND